MNDPRGLHPTPISQKGKPRPSDGDSLLPHGKLSLLLQFLLFPITVSEPLHEDPGLSSCAESQCW